MRLTLLLVSFALSILVVLRAVATPDAGSGVEGVVDEELQGQVEETVVEEVQAAVEQSVEQSVEGASEAEIEAAAEEQVEQVAEEAVEDSVEEVAQSDVEDALDESVQETVEESVENSVEEVAQSDVEGVIEESVEQSVEEVVDAGLEDAIDDATTESIIDTTEERIVVEMEELVGELETELTVAEGNFHLGDWLILATPEVFDELDAEGFIFDDVTDLPSLELKMGVATAPASFDIDRAREGIMDVVDDEDVRVDLNHIYTAGAELSPDLEGSLNPATAMPFPGLSDYGSLRIGMADSSLDIAHPALAGAAIEAADFAVGGGATPKRHGTAIASILVGESAELTGIARGAKLFAAGVFSQDKERGEYASALSIIKALDWLLQNNVSVINLSMAGPPNALLERALQKVVVSGVVVVAAAGNGGPLAEPMYPAAYDNVVAVTAVDARQRAYRLANRGAYVDVAAPGVNVRHALPGGGYAASSGTSYAVPFAVLEAARLKLADPQGDVLAQLRADAIDLGDPGFDQIYGYGLLQPR